MHFHAVYGEYEALITLDGKVYAGKLPGRALSLVREWLALHRDENAFASIKQGLTEAITHAKGNQAGVIEYRPYAVDVAALRRRLALTQEHFAARFGFSVATLRHLGTRRPPPARVLRNLNDRAPETVMHALHAA